MSFGVDVCPSQRFALHGDVDFSQLVGIWLTHSVESALDKQSGPASVLAIAGALKALIDVTKQHQLDMVGKGPRRVGAFRALPMEHEKKSVHLFS